MSKERERLLGENRAESLRTWRGQPADESELVLNKQAAGDTGASAGGGEAGDPVFYIMVDELPGTPGGRGVLYIVNVVTGEWRSIGRPTGSVNRLTGLAMDPVDNVLWSVQQAPGYRIISFSEEAVLESLFNPTFYAVPAITIGADRIIRGWHLANFPPNLTMVYSRINGAITPVAYTGVSGQNVGVGVANTEEAGVGYIKSNNQLWSVNWASGAYTNVCGYVPEVKAGYNDPMVSAFCNWANGTLIGVRRNIDNTESTFYRLTTDGGITTLGSVPLAVWGITWAPGREV